MRDVDARIGAACDSAQLTYSRYVDDITISGAFDLDRDKAGILALAEQILSEHGFAAKRSKSESSRNGTATITGVRIKRGRFDVAKAYAVELERQLLDAASLSVGGAFTGPFFTRGQILGRVQFVSWINPGRKKALRAKFLRINWRQHKALGIEQGWVATKKHIQRRRLNADAGGPAPGGIQLGIVGNED